MAANALVNGINISWSNIICVIAGTPIVGITTLTYSRDQKKDNNYGMGSEPVSRGYGQTTYKGSITIYYDELKRMAAAAPNGDITKLPPFSIIVIFEGLGIGVSKETLTNVEFTEDPFSSNSGDTAIKVSVPLIIGGIDKS